MLVTTDKESDEMNIYELKFMSNKELYEKIVSYYEVFSEERKQMEKYMIDVEKADSKFFLFNRTGHLIERPTTTIAKYTFVELSIGGTRFAMFEDTAEKFSNLKHDISSITRDIYFSGIDNAGKVKLIDIIVNNGIMEWDNWGDAKIIKNILDR